MSHLNQALIWVSDDVIFFFFQGMVFSIKAQISCLPGQVLMNATVPRPRGAWAGR